jgi:manganese/zinc/iron transport system ATP- binding protein
MRFHLPNLSYSRRHYAPPVPGAPALEITDLSAVHPGTTYPALHNLTVTIPVGARIALVGPNGAGKSTLIKAIAGLLPARTGKILIYGLPVGACHHRVAYLPQRSELDWRFPVSVRRLVLSGRYVHMGWLRGPSHEDKAIVDAAIAQMGLSALADRQIGQLSGGQQQRALLARALAQDADLLLLDEPLNAVDNDTRAVVAEVISSLHARGKTSLTATHDLGRLEQDFDDAIYLAGGVQVPPPPGSFVGAAHRQREFA